MYQKVSELHHQDIYIKNYHTLTVQYVSENKNSRSNKNTNSRYTVTVKPYFLSQCANWYTKEQVSCITKTSIPKPIMHWQCNKWVRARIPDQTRKQQSTQSTRLWLLSFTFCPKAHCSGEPIFFPVPILTNFRPFFAPSVFFVKTQWIRSKPSNFTNFLFIIK